MASIQADMPFHLIGGSLDDKQNFKTLEEMKNCPEDSLGKTAMCTNDEDGKIYVFNINNEVSEETGKWKVVEGNSTPSSLDDDTDWVSTGLGIITDSEKITINDISLKRVGDAVSFMIHGFMKTECSNTTVTDIITNIPDKYRPNSSASIPVLGHGTGNNVGIYVDEITFTSNGTLNLSLQGTPKDEYFSWEGHYHIMTSDIEKLGINKNINKIELFNDGWKFKLISSVSHETYNSTEETLLNFDDSTWKDVTLPHDWSIYNDFNPNSLSIYEGGYLDGGDAWYRKKINFSKCNDKNIYLYFDGIYMESDLYINGVKVGENKNGYNPFYYDITDYINDGENIIAIFVRNKQISSRWYSGSGIYRNVYLLISNKVYVDIDGIFIKTPNLKEEIKSGIVTTNIKIELNNSYETDKEVTIKTKIYSNGKLINNINTVNTLLTGSNNITQNIQIPNPKLWDVYDGNIYDVEVDVYEENTLVNKSKTYFGYRYCEFNSDGFYINGNKIKIKGVCMHHDLGCLGAEINKSAMLRQIRILKEMGCNAIRLTHNPSSPEYMRLCAEEGIMLVEELFDVWKVSKKKYDFARYFTDNWETVVTTTVKRSRNNPAVIMWSLGNEIWDTRNYENNPVETATLLKNKVKSLDDTRPVTMGEDRPTTESGVEVMGVMDVIGINYGSDSEYTSVRNNYPNKCIYGSETTSALSTRGCYATDEENLRYSSLDDVKVSWGEYASAALLQHMNSDYLAGMFVWTGFDYIGEPTLFNKYPAKSSYFGIVDLAGFPKDIYYMYQSRWSNKPMIHILPHWTYKDGVGSKTIWIYSNCDRVELFLNNKSLGVKTKEQIGEKLQFEYVVEYKKGTLIANGYNEEGTLIAQDIVNTSGVANKLELKSKTSIINNNNGDLLFVECYVKDSNNNLCPESFNEITFNCTGGTIVGTDNGDSADVTNMKSNIRKAFYGKCLCVIKPNSENGDIVVTATSDGLIEGSITIPKGNITAFNKTSQTFVEIGPEISDNIIFNVNKNSLSNGVLSDNVSNIEAVLTGNPTVSNNKLSFASGDSFNFDVSSLNLSQCTIKFVAQQTTNVNSSNIISIGTTGANDWNYGINIYQFPQKDPAGIGVQFGKMTATNVNVGVATTSKPYILTNDLLTEHEYVLSFNKSNTKFMIWVDGELKQDCNLANMSDGSTNKFIINNISNTQGNSRFIGTYTEISIYNTSISDYSELENL